MKKTLILVGLSFLKLMSISQSATISPSAESWNGSLDFGASLATGNTDTMLITAGLQLSKNVASDEYAANLSYAYGESEDETTADEVLAVFAWKRLLTDITYAGLRADFRHDELAEIDYRTSVTAIYGAYLIKEEAEMLSLEAGIGYVFEDLSNVSDDYVSFYLGQSYERKISDSARVYQTLSFMSPLDDLNDYSLVAELGVETTISEKMSLKVYLQDRYEAEPSAHLDKNDLKIVTGVSYKF